MCFVRLLKWAERKERGFPDYNCCCSWYVYKNWLYYKNLPPDWKLVRTNLNYRVLGTSIAATLLSNDNSLYALFTSDECHAWFHLYGLRIWLDVWTNQSTESSNGLSRPARSAWKAITFQNEISLHVVGLESTTFRFVAMGSSEWPSKAWWSYPFKMTFIHSCTCDTIYKLI